MIYPNGQNGDGGVGTIQQPPTNETIISPPSPDALAIQAVATDLEMRPLKGKVEGKNTGKNVLVRSLSGMGQVGAMLVGRGNLNQPFSESDLLRERVGNNIGQAVEAISQPAHRGYNFGRYPDLCRAGADAKIEGVFGPIRIA